MKVSTIYVQKFLNEHKDLKVLKQGTNQKDSQQVRRGHGIPANKIIIAGIIGTCLNVESKKRGNQHVMSCCDGVRQHREVAQSMDSGARLPAFEILLNQLLAG